MGKKLAEVRNWNPISEETVKQAFANIGPATAAASPAPEPPKADNRPPLPRRTIIKEAPTFKQFRMAEADNLVVEQLLTGLRANLGVKVTFTDLVHALVFMLDKKCDEVFKEAQGMTGRLPRPQLADGPAMREFQKALALVLLDGVSGKNRFM